MINNISTIIAAFACFVFILSCDTNESNNFREPIGANGIKFHNDLIWITDLIGQNITAFEPETGKIRQQYDFKPLGLSPDDLVFMDDETIVWTAPPNDVVGKITPDGEIVVLATNLGSVNPIERKPGTDEVYIGFESDDAQVRLLNIEDGSTTQVALDLPSINGFSFAEDGLLYAPLFNTDNLFAGTGGVIKIDIESGTHELLAVTFPNNPNKSSLVSTTGIVADLNGSIYVLESVLNPKVFKVDLSTNEAFLVGDIPAAATDNIALSDDGKVYVSGFFLNEVFEFDAEGNRRKIVINNKFN